MGNENRLPTETNEQTSEILFQWAEYQIEKGMSSKEALDRAARAYGFWVEGKVVEMNEVLEGKR